MATALAIKTVYTFANI